jgi:hypothetical protein
VQCTYTNEVASPPADLTILKAEYGAFAAASDPESVDVTDAVKKMVKQGTLRIPASNDLAGDPAANVEKDMRIEFMDGGEHKTRTVPEGQLLELPAGAVVIKAVYGIISDEVAPVNQTMDLTEKLGGLVKDGRLSVEAGNELAGRDPANMVVKELRVEYRYAGEKKLAIVGEHQQLDLPQDDESAPAPPKHVVAVDEGGKLQIEAWEPGRFEVKTAAGKTLKVDVGEVPAPVEITGSWELDFPPNWGAPKKITLDKLISWTEHPDNGVKYFSGTATYVKDVEIPAALVGRGKALYLDLGQLKNLAEVKLNGKDLGILWKPPFRVAISGAATAGTNKLEVRVTNLWPNRLIGDEQLPDDRVWDGKHLKEWPQWLLEGKPSPTGRFTFTTWHHWTRDDAPLPSGLFGPVKLLPTVIVDVLPAP